MAATLLDEGKERPVLGPKLRQRVPECIEFLGIHGAFRLGHIFMLRGEGQEDPAQLLAAEVVDAGVARQAEEPGLELLGGLKPVQGADHFNKYLLGNIFH